ncbi:MAG: class I SAM-dependent methyltransferase [Verrucomicrobia bacterium]|nr:class I SAM-dependent methyltransferase [Verrucomicrobiota bacterium]MBV9657580.1 class I SAM-dependent methyltransferase [Verrucomicrobiota bacterium]
MTLTAGPTSATSAKRVFASALPTPAAGLRASNDDSLFEHFAWLYAFFREHVFRDDTDGIAAALWPSGSPLPGSRLLEIGCGPGFYACRLAERFRSLRVLGIDRSREQLRHAEKRACRRRLTNCQFQCADALALDEDLGPGSVDALLSVRLFTVLPAADRAESLARMHRVLKPGGRCFIAEPRSRLRATVPLRLMWAAARLSALCGSARARAFREPPGASVLSPDEFGPLMMTQPWHGIWRWQDRHYQYALCEKAGAVATNAAAPTASAGSHSGPEDFVI